jgi:hypothetical protein
MHEWEQYRDRYAQKIGTFDAYVDIWQTNRIARQRFGSWSTFSRCANAEPKMVRDHPERVSLAEQILAQEGYEPGPPTPRGSRTWRRRQ